jgi:prephenate dehydrogenase
METIKHIAIIGMGLIGGSLALDLKRSNPEVKIFGVEKNQETIRKAETLKLADIFCSVDEAVQNSELIVIATPPDVAMEMLKTVMPMVTNQIVTDVCSVKKPLIELANTLPHREQFVAAHPMAGTEYSGPQAASEGLFCQKACIICDTHDNDQHAVDIVSRMFQQLGMHITKMDAAAHDQHAAYVSHISHITSFALALTVLEKEHSERNIFELASGGFDSTVRLAKSAASMWNPVFFLNRENMLDVIDNYEKQIAKFRQAIEKSDQQKLKTLIEKSNEIKKVIK